LLEIVKFSLLIFRKLVTIANQLRKLNPLKQSLLENPMTTVNKQRIRRLTVAQIVREDKLVLEVDVIDTGSLILELSLNDISPEFLHKLALRGIASFVQDRTAKVTELGELPAAIAQIFNAIKDETIFNSVRTSKTSVELPKFVEAILVRDQVNNKDLVIRQEALLHWEALTEIEKKALRADKELRSLVAIANGEAAKERLGIQGTIDFTK